MAHLSLQECISYFAVIPDKFMNRYQVRPTVNEAIELVENLRHSYIGRAAWFTHEVFNYESEAPPILTSTDFYQYSPFGVMSKATLELCRAAWRKSALLKEISPSPANLWLMCEISHFFKVVVDTGLGDYFQLPGFEQETKKLQGKVEIYQEYSDGASLRADPGLLTETIPFSSLQVPCTRSVLLTEAQHLTRKVPGFQELHWESYWNTSDWFVNKICHEENFQITCLLKEELIWKLYQGGKSRRMPLTKSKGFSATKRARGRPPKSNTPRL